MSRKIYCTSCGVSLTEAIGPCPKCGGEITLEISLTGIPIGLQQGSVGIVKDSTNNGNHQIEIKTPEGKESISFLQNNQLQLIEFAPVDIGKKGEPRVIALIQSHLLAQGNIVENLPAQDNKGEDAVFSINKQRVIIQICSLPLESHYQQVSIGGSKLLTDLDNATELINEAIGDKANSYPIIDKAQTLLAVDMHHLGALCKRDLGEKYIQKHGDPSLTNGFGAVWLVGPTEILILKLGKSKW